MYVCMYVVIATSIVLAEADFLQALYDGLELLNDFSITMRTAQLS